VIETVEVPGGRGECDRLIYRSWVTFASIARYWRSRRVVAVTSPVGESWEAVRTEGDDFARRAKRTPSEPASSRRGAGE
jgi:hypothetical protein